MLIDTHSHLFASEFNTDRKQVVESAINAGIDKIVLPNIDVDTASLVDAMISEYPGRCYGLMGLHPCHVNENVNSQLEEIHNIICRGNYVGIGETGLDFFHDVTFRKQQVESFQKHAEWAIQMDLPLIIHTRNSMADVIDIIRSNKLFNPGLKGIFHCFAGTAEDAEAIMDLGFLLGIGGVLTFKNSGLDKIVKDIPLDFLVLETDSPYLAPHPYRGKRNESAFIVNVAQKLADIKQVDLKTIEEVTTSNANKLFRF